MVFWSGETPSGKHKPFQQNREVWPETGPTVIRGASGMNISIVKNVMNSLMIISFVIFLALASIMVATDTDLTTRAVSLPFTFLFISIMTFVTTGKLDEQPATAERTLRQWVLICVFVVLISAVAFTLA
jgi:hypothetical protein